MVEKRKKMSINLAQQNLPTYLLFLVSRTMVNLEWSANNSCFTLYAILLPYSIGCIGFFDISSQPTELPQIWAY